MISQYSIGIITGILASILTAMLIYLFYLALFKRKKHDLSSIRKNILEINKASETIKNNSGELNKVMENLEYA